MKRIISIITLILFSLNNVSLAGEVYSHHNSKGINLAPPLVFNPLGDDIHHKFMTLAEMALQKELIELDKLIDIDGATDFGVIKKAFKKNEKFNSNKLAFPGKYISAEIDTMTNVTCYFDNVDHIGGHIFSVPVCVSDYNGYKNYTLLFSTIRKDGGFPTTIGIKEEIKELEESIVKNDKLPAFPEEDVEAMERYKEQEIYDRKVLEWAHGQKGEDDEDLAFEIDVGDEIDEILETAKIEIEGGRELIKNRKYFIVSRTPEVEYRLQKHMVTVIDAKGNTKRIPAYSHSSNHSVHIFLNPIEAERLREEKNSSEMHTGNLRNYLMHEIGVMLGLPIKRFVMDKYPSNEIDYRYAIGGSKQWQELNVETYPVVDLNKNLGSRDYAGDKTLGPSKKRLANLKVSNILQEEFYLIALALCDSPKLTDADIVKTATERPQLPQRSKKAIIDLVQRNYSVTLDDDVDDSIYVGLIRAVAMRRMTQAITDHGEMVIMALAEEKKLTDKMLQTTLNRESKKVLSDVFFIVRDVILSLKEPKAERILWKYEAIMDILGLVSSVRQKEAEKMQKLHIVEKVEKKVVESLTHNHELLIEDLEKAEAGEITSNAQGMLEAAYESHGMPLKEVYFLLAEPLVVEHLSDLLRKVREGKYALYAKAGLERYEEHEIYDREVIKWAHDEGLAVEVNAEYDIDYVLDQAMIHVDDADNPIRKRKYFIVPYTENDKMHRRLKGHMVTVVDAEGNKKPIIAYSHSSNNNIHIFLTQKDVQALKQRDQDRDWERTFGGLDVFRKYLAHEIGAMTGCSLELFRYYAKKPINDVDLRYGSNKAQEFSQLPLYPSKFRDYFKKLKIVNLNENLEYRDYAGNLPSEDDDGGRKDRALYIKIFRELIDQLKTNLELNKDDIKAAKSGPQVLTENAKKVVTKLLKENGVIDPLENINESRYLNLIKFSAVDRVFLARESVQKYGRKVVKVLVGDQSATDEALLDVIQKDEVSDSLLETTSAAISEIGEVKAERILWAGETTNFILLMTARGRQDKYREEGRFELKRKYGQAFTIRDKIRKIKGKLKEKEGKIIEILVRDKKLVVEDLEKAENEEITPNAEKILKDVYAQNELPMNDIYSSLGEFSTGKHLLTLLRKVRLQKYATYGEEALEGYEKHEKYDKNVLGWLHEEREDLLFKVDTNGDIDEILEIAAINIEGGADSIKKREYFIIPLVDDVRTRLRENLVTIPAVGKKIDIMAFAHSSNHSVHIFLPTEIVEVLKEQEKSKTIDEELRKSFREILAHEIGVMLGCPVTRIGKFSGKLIGQIGGTYRRPVNDIDDRYRDGKTAILPKKTFFVANLDENLKTRDYAGGLTEALIELLTVRDWTLPWKKPLSKLKSQRKFDDPEVRSRIEKELSENLELTDEDLKAAHYTDPTFGRRLTPNARKIMQELLLRERINPDVIDGFRWIRTISDVKVIRDDANFYIPEEKALTYCNEHIYDFIEKLSEGGHIRSLKEEDFESALVGNITLNARETMWKILAPKKIRLNNSLDSVVLKILSILEEKSTAQRIATLHKALDSVPEEYWTNGINQWEFVVSLFRGESTKMHAKKAADRKSAFIFSEKVTFDKGVGVFLPKLVESGIKVAVVAKTPEQKHLIQKLNDTKLADSENKIICEESVAEAASSLVTQKKAARCYYLRITADAEEGIPDGVTSIPLSAVEFLIRAIAEAAKLNLEAIQQFHKAARIFATAA